MAKPNSLENITDILGKSIAADVGNIIDTDLDDIQSSFNTLLGDTLETFNTPSFDKDGFLNRMMNINLPKSDQDAFRRILGSVRTDYVDVNTIKHNDLLMRRDIYNICQQMPEMHDVIMTVRDSVVDSDVVTGGVSRTTSFLNNDDESIVSKIKEIETEFNLELAIKNFIVPQTLINGEMYINIVPYSKLFAEMDALAQKKGGLRMGDTHTTHTESKKGSKKEAVGLFTESNLTTLKGSITPFEQSDIQITYRTEKTTPSDKMKPETAFNKAHDQYLTSLLENISIHEDSSVLFREYGAEGLKAILQEDVVSRYETGSKDRSFFENVLSNNNIPEEDIKVDKFKHIKGCYVKYLNALRVIPVRLDRRVIGYYYVTTTADLQMNPNMPNGIVDLSFQHYTRNKNLVESLSNIIIRSFNKEMLNSNIQLKSDIAEIIMEHRFSEGRLSFIYIPETEIVRIIVNEDENGKGHSIIEPSLHPARMFMILNLFNMLYTLNNSMTRIHYVRSSGLNTNYAAQIQRTIRKFQSRRIDIDDIYSYTGVLNKVGGLNEMVLPMGRGSDFRALETDTLQGSDIPINLEQMEVQRRQAISGTGIPSLMILNGMDDIDFAKTIEMANRRFMSTVSSYKIDLNKGITLMYKRLLKHCTDLTDAIISSFVFKFNAVKSPELTMTSQMVQDFNAKVELAQGIHFSNQEMVDENNNPTNLAIAFKKNMVKRYMPHFEVDELDEIVSQSRLDATQMDLQQKVKTASLDQQDLDRVQQTTGADETEE